MLLKFQDITFSHDQAVTPLLDKVSWQFAPGWTGIVGPNGTGKTTLLRLACGDFTPQRGHVRVIGKIVYCPQRTDHAPELLAAFLRAMDREACRLRGQLEIDPEWGQRWSTLSHGERKRAQIAVALWQAPQVLAIDEPTNHIDGQARRLLGQALRSFRGIGLLVSHDRRLLDDLCRECLFMEPPNVIPRPGGYTQAAAQASLEDESRARQRELAERKLGQLEREVTARKGKASRADRMRSKRGIAKKDHDAKEKINQARLTGKDGQAGRLARQLRGRTRQMQQELAQMEVKKVHQVGIWLPDSRSRRKALFSLPEGVLALGERRSLRYPALHMTPDGRIGVTGPNGAGKTSLLRHLLASLDLAGDKVVYLPQEIELGRAREILARVRKLSRGELGRVMTIVSRLGSRPERLLQTAEPSPGELRKLLLALGIIKSPHLVIMDEPTNHLDLPAIQCLEDALADCPSGLLLVSHDLVFLEHLARTHWRIQDGLLTIGETWR